MFFQPPIKIQEGKSQILLLHLAFLLKPCIEEWTLINWRHNKIHYFLLSWDVVIPFNKGSKRLWYPKVIFGGFASFPLLSLFVFLPLMRRGEEREAFFKSPMSDGDSKDWGEETFFPSSWTLVAPPSRWASNYGSQPWRDQRNYFIFIEICSKTW